MPRINRETVDKILDTADIVEVVSDFVKLRRSGANYKGLCPFHNERTPSFSVNKARNICKCFSCGKGGSPVGFIMEHEQMSYSEALRWLARKYNIEVIEEEVSDAQREEASMRESMFSLNEFALNHFENNLVNTEEGETVALPYFRHRGISDQMIKRFHLGYSVERSNDLLATALSKGFKEDILVSTGLCIKTDRGDCYDRFRGRVMFPIHTVSGRVVGFGGRTMRSEKTVAKYVNSPESLIYSKKKEIYGLFQAKSAIAKKNKAIMVEGYMDVISMHQAGVENVVSSSGTSLTQEQIRALMRFTPNITVIYDADPAGIKASLRGINLILAEGLNVKALLLPEGEDPDSFAQSHSASEVEKFLEDNEQDIIAFMTSILMKDVKLNDPTSRASVINSILQTVAMVDDNIIRREYLSQCARSFGIEEDVLLVQLNRFVAMRVETIEREARRIAAQESLRQNELDSQVSETEDALKNDAEIAFADIGQKQPSDFNLNPALLPYEHSLLKYAVKYGLMNICDIPDEEGNLQPINVSSLIERELKARNIEFSDSAVKRTFEEILSLASSESFESQHNEAYQSLLIEREKRLNEGRELIRRTIFSVPEIQRAEEALIAQADDELFKKLDRFDSDFLLRALSSSACDDVRNLSIDLSLEKHTLSKIHSKGKQIHDNEQEIILPLITRALTEYQAAILAFELKKMNSELKKISSPDDEAAKDILKRIIDLQRMQTELAKNIGDRIILPRRR